MEAVGQAIGEPHARHLFKRPRVQHECVAIAIRGAHNRYDNS
jgi:hypothetical protein